MSNRYRLLSADLEDAVDPEKVSAESRRVFFSHLFARSDAIGTYVAPVAGVVARCGLRFDPSSGVDSTAPGDCFQAARVFTQLVPALSKRKPSVVPKPVMISRRVLVVLFSIESAALHSHGLDFHFRVLAFG